MVCRLIAPSHYLNQCWNIANWTIRNTLQWNFSRNSSIFIQENAFEIVVCEMVVILSRPQCVKGTTMHIRSYIEYYIYMSYIYTEIDMHTYGYMCYINTVRQTEKRHHRTVIESRHSVYDCVHLARDSITPWIAIFPLHVERMMLIYSTV